MMELVPSYTLSCGEIPSRRLSDTLRNSSKDVQEENSAKTQELQQESRQKIAVTEGRVNEIEQRAAAAERSVNETEQFGVMVLARTLQESKSCDVKA